MRGSPAVLPLATALLLGGCVRHSPLPRQMETAFGPVRLGVPWNPVDLAGVGLGDTIVDFRRERFRVADGLRSTVQPTALSVASGVTIRSR
jgi:hypothetical protein